MFLLSQNDENQSENGSKNSKIRLRARPPAEPQKKMLQTKKLRSKSWKTRGFFHFSLADFGRARSRTGVFRTVFYSVFWRRASRPIKNRRFYECHPEDHAPAPSVRADLIILRVCFTGLPPKGDVRMFGRKALARETPCFQFRVSQGFKNIWKSHVNY